MKKRAGKHQFQQSGLKIPPVEGEVPSAVCSVPPSVHPGVFPVLNTHDGSGSGIALLLSLSTSMPCFCPACQPWLGHVNEHWFLSLCMDSWIDFWLAMGSAQVPWPVSPRQHQQDPQPIPAGWVVQLWEQEQLQELEKSPRKAQGWSGIHIGQRFTCRIALLLEETWGNLTVWSPALGTHWNVPFLRVTGFCGMGGGVLVRLHHKWWLGCFSRDASTGECSQNQMLTCKEGFKCKKKLKLKEESPDFYSHSQTTY